MQKIDIQPKTEISTEEQVITLAMRKCGYIEEEIEGKIALLKNKEDLEIRDSVIKEIGMVMKSQRCGFSPNYTYRILSLVCNLSAAYVSGKVQSVEIRKYSKRNKK
jgi:hypothetical protein